MLHRALSHGDRRIVLHSELLELLQDVEVLRLEVRLLAGRTTRVDLRLAVEAAPELVGHERDERPPGATSFARLLKQTAWETELVFGTSFLKSGCTDKKAFMWLKHS